MSDTKPTVVMIGDEERAILAAYRAANGLSESKGTSAAIRQIIRDWAKRNSNKQDEVKAA